jgi:hypothetical protein
MIFLTDSYTQTAYVIDGRSARKARLSYADLIEAKHNFATSIVRFPVHCFQERITQH